MVTGLGLLTNGFLLLGAWWLAGHGLLQRSRVDRLLASSVLAFSWCVLGLESLGSLGWLAPVFLLGWAASLFTLGLILKLRNRLARVVALPGGDDPQSWGRLALVAVTLVIWASALLLMQSLMLPVKVVSDGPIYHLYFAIRWWKAGRLFLVASPFGENGATYFPANGDLWFTWLITTWDGDRLAKVGQAPFLAIAAVAAYGIARQLRAGGDSSRIAACWFASATPLMAFTFEANVDTIFVAAYLTAAHFLLRHLLDRNGQAPLALAGLAAGLAMGTKPVGVLFVVPLLVLALGAEAWTTHLGRRTWLSALVLAACAFLTSGFWFVRNLLVTGNPLYPLQIELLGSTIFPGCYLRAAMQESIYYIPASEWRALVDILLLVVDPRMALMWVPALLGFWRPGGGQDESRDGWVWAASGLAVLNVALYWLGVPYRTQQRFMLQALGLAAAPLARLLDRGTHWRTLAVILLALHLMTSQPWPVATREQEIPWDLDPRIPNVAPPPIPLAPVLARLLDPSPDVRAILNLAVLSGMGGCAWLTAWALGRGAPPRRARTPQWAWAAAGLGGLFLLGVLSTGAIETGPRERFYPAFPDFHRGWLQLEARSGPTGSRVAYAGTNIPYYLFGIGLRNDVRYVNVNRHRDWLLHDYQRAARERGEPLWPNSRPGWDRAEPDFDAWLANLRAERIVLLVVTRVNPGEGPHNVADTENFPIERQWAEGHPEHFEPVYGVREPDPFFRIYRLRSPQ